MSSSTGEMEAGVKWQFEAWSESRSKSNSGKPSFWSVYTFNTEKEAIKERDRLERKWKNPKNLWPDSEIKTYLFEVYRVEITKVHRKCKNCNGTGSVEKKGPIAHGERRNRVCQACHGSGKAKKYPGLSIRKKK